ncbi:DUF72 domain-containing protein [Oxalobacteraceae bacterium]|nr:DUF72 domain-containing protein [Oxalobacteraceae bacterium]
MTVTRIGCAGWAIPGRDAAHFASGGSQLERYGSVFNAVEINTSFYRPHRAQTYVRWAESVPDDFLFSVKLPRSISHDARLDQAEQQLDRFAIEAGSLGHKLGCVLVQLPPSLPFDAAIATTFFEQARARFGCMIACEARHPSWFDQPANALLEAVRITRVRADPPAGQPGPHHPTTRQAYLRLHGSPRVYYSSYGDAVLDQRARELASLDAWCIFDNTASGAAIPNALALMERLQTGSPAPVNAPLSPRQEAYSLP